MSKGIIRRKPATNASTVRTLANPPSSLAITIRRPSATDDANIRQSQPDQQEGDAKSCEVALSECGFFCLRCRVSATFRQSVCQALSRSKEWDGLCLRNLALRNSKEYKCV